MDDLDVSSHHLVAEVQEAYRVIVDLPGAKKGCTAAGRMPRLQADADRLSFSLDRMWSELGSPGTLHPKHGWDGVE